jgi:hypothetical protein
MKELVRVRVQYATRQQCCKTHKRPLPFYLLTLIKNPPFAYIFFQTQPKKSLNFLFKLKEGKLLLNWIALSLLHAKLIKRKEHGLLFCVLHN